MTREVSKDRLVKDCAGNFRIPESANDSATSKATIIDSDSPYRDVSGIVRFPEIPEK